MRVGERFVPYRKFTGSILPNPLMKHPGLSPQAKLLWAKLAQHAGKDGICFPSQETLAVELGVSARTIRRAMQELVSNNFIRITRIRHGVKPTEQFNKYEFIFHECLEQRTTLSGDIGEQRTDMVGTQDKNGQEHRTDLSYKENHLRESLKERIYSPNSVELRLSTLLFSLIKERDPKRRAPNLQRWADDIEKLIGIDKRTEAEIEEVIRWCQGDKFWKNNILSTNALREKFSDLKLKMQSGSEPEVIRVKNGKRVKVNSRGYIFQREESPGVWVNVTDEKFEGW